MLPSHHCLCRQAVQAIAVGAKVTDFYLATNGSPDEVEQLKNDLAKGSPAIALHRFGNAYESQDVGKTDYQGFGDFSSLQVATIEQAIASRAERFCGTLYSTFSMQVNVSACVPCLTCIKTHVCCPAVTDPLGAQGAGC